MESAGPHRRTEPAPLVLLDLDGTLSDSAPGIFRAARAAFESMGLQAPTDDILRGFVGPPLTVSFGAFGVPAHRVVDAITAYRAEFEAGAMWQSEPFPGIAHQLQVLREAGCTLAVATSKPETLARRICARWGLDLMVDGVYGAPPDDVPSTKATVIAHALEELGAERVPARDASVMVGDRHHDVDGAAAHGIRCLGAGWGYAEPGELDGALATVPTVGELAGAVLSVVGRPAEQSRLTHVPR